MPKTRQQKEEILNKVLENIKNSKSVVFANFEGLKVKEVEELRKKCKEAGVEYFVAKKTLLKKALEEEGYSDYDLPGEVGSAFSMEDEVAAAKVLNDFAKDHEQLQFIAGILENNMIDAEGVKNLAKLPSKDELLAKMVGSLKAPVSGFVNVLSGNLRGLVQVLNAIKEQKS